MLANRVSKMDAIWIFLVGLFLFTMGLQHQEIIGFESRFYLFALEMWRHGFTGFPTTYETPYPDYPVTSTALIYLSAKLFGMLNKWVAVFPSAVAAGSTLSATYLIGALQERRWGFYSVGFLLLTLAFITEARTISLDMYVTAFTAWIFYFVYSAKLQKNTSSWWVVGILLSLSFSIRGPIGIVIPTGVLFVFYLLEKDWKSLVKLCVLSVMLLAACTGVLLCIAYDVGGKSFMDAVLRMEILGRMQENRTPAHSFYFIESMGAYAVTYPLFVFILLGNLFQLIKKNSSQQIHFLRILTGWVFVIMIGLSIPADKKIRYILPMAPALALMCPSLFIMAHNSFLLWTKKVFNFLCRIFPLLGLVVLSVLYKKQVSLSYDILIFIFLVAQFLVLFSKNNLMMFFVASVTFFLGNVFIAEQINLQANQTARFVQTIENLREKQHAKLGFYGEGKDGLVIKYLANMQREDEPTFFSKVSDISSGAWYLIATEENFNALSLETRKSFRIINSGKLGHDKVVVFVLH